MPIFFDGRQQPPQEPERCPECKGTGKITLLTSSKPCTCCGGKGETLIVLGRAIQTVSIAVGRGQPRSVAVGEEITRCSGAHTTWQYGKPHPDIAKE